MLKKFLAAMFLLMIASISFTGNVIAVAISSQEGGQSQVGYSLLIISGISLAAVVFIALWIERNYQYREKEGDGA